MPNLLKSLHVIAVLSSLSISVIFANNFPCRYHEIGQQIVGQAAVVTLC